MPTYFANYEKISNPKLFIFRVLNSADSFRNIAKGIGDRISPILTKLCFSGSEVLLSLSKNYFASA
jgi:hypothetical protein